MSDIIAVIEPRLERLNFKAEALLFDRIAIDGLHWFTWVLSLEETDIPNKKQSLAELEWLIAQNIIFQPRAFEQNTPRIQQAFKESNRNLTAGWKILSSTKLDKNGNIDPSQPNANKIKTELEELLSKSRDPWTRLVALMLREYDNLDAYPLLGSLSSYDDPTLRRAEVLHVVFRSLPLPDELTSWNDILDFRKQNKPFLTGLRTWVTEVTQGKLTASEIEDKLEWQLHEREEHLRISGIKINTGVLETIVTTVADVADDISHFKFSKLAKRLFSLHQKKINFLEAELSSPSRELAYIQRAKKEFGRV